MLELKGDIFPNYNFETFENELKKENKIISKNFLSELGVSQNTKNSLIFLISLFPIFAIKSNILLIEYIISLRYIY